MPWFRNHYTCPQCDRDWTDDWSATCDDDCPHCGFRHVSPDESEDRTAIMVAAEDGSFQVLRSPDTAEHAPDYRHLKTFPRRQEAEAFLADVLINGGVYE